MKHSKFHRTRNDGSMGEHLTETVSKDPGLKSKVDLARSTFSL